MDFYQAGVQLFLDFVRYMFSVNLYSYYIRFNEIFNKFVELLIYVFLIMLEFKKNILTKVSFDLELFEKELRKAIRWINPTEVTELRDWCYNQFDENFNPILNKVFAF